MKFLPLLMTFCLMLAGCANTRPSAPVSATLHDDAAHPAQTDNWVRTELYFGVGLIDGDPHAVSETQWRDFLDREVTSRFPAGLTVLDAYGQWHGKDAAGIERLRTKIIVLLYEDTPAQRADIEAIRLAWKKFTGDQSVLRVTQHVDVSF